MLTTHQAADRLSITHSLVCKYIRDGRLPAAKFGKSWVIQESDLDTFASTPRTVGWKKGKPRKSEYPPTKNAPSNRRGRFLLSPPVNAELSRLSSALSNTPTLECTA